MIPASWQTACYNFLMTNYNPNTDQSSRIGNCRLHPRALKGISLFNAHLFFEAHEELEIAWREEPDTVREVYRGILQVAVGYHHWSRKNYNGALKMFHSCRKWLAPFVPAYGGIQVAPILEDVDRLETILLSAMTGNTDIPTPDFPPIHILPTNPDGNHDG
ncbi:MAG: DUF309 domain-containing protein [Chloroflexi bacterium]|nr:DUF309 domain-containing protein [Chloroflexota bacterium]